MTTLYIGVDPGSLMSGLAMKYDDRPHCATLLRVSKGTLGERVAQYTDQVAYNTTCVTCDIHVAVELMQVYDTAQREGDPNDLVDLATIGGAVAAALRARTTGKATFEYPQPRQWKGTIDKTVHHNRLKRDHPEWVPLVEEKVITAPRGRPKYRVPPGMQNHVWDAVGLTEWLITLERNRHHG